jgi:hypothetical protein
LDARPPTDSKYMAESVLLQPSDIFLEDITEIRQTVEQLRQAQKMEALEAQPPASLANGLR